MEQFLEVQNWGFNVLVISSFFTVICSLFQGYGFIKQSQKIWKEKSVKSLSAPFFFLFFFYFVAFIFYGFSKHSLAMMANSMLCIPCIPIVIGVIKFKKLNLKDWLAFALSLCTVPIMILIKDKDAFISALFFVNLIVLITQPLTMIKEKSRGSVEIKFVIIFFLTSVCWLFYSLIINNLALLIFNLVAMFAYGLIAYLYKKYKV